MLHKKLELKKHNDNLLSIKDGGGEINFSDSELNIVFEKCIDQAGSIFFKGERGCYESEEINLLLNNYSDLVIYPKNCKLSVLCKIPAGCLMMSRNGFKLVWEHYEYPFIFFIGKGVQDAIIEQLKKDTLLADTIKTLKRSIVLYRSFEQDVLWVQKSSDIEFPDFIS